MTFLKLVHVTAVVLSLTGFFLRGVAALAGSPLLERRFVRVAPHVVDTVLLASGVALAVTWHIDPTQQPWLAAKLLALPVYVVLGAFALRRARSRPRKALAFAAALAVAAYIVGAALRHSPLSWLA